MWWRWRGLGAMGVVDGRNGAEFRLEKSTGEGPDMMD